MKTTALTIAAAAIGLAGFAYADEAKEATEVAKAPTLMTEAQMDDIVAAGDKDTVVLVQRGNGTFKCKLTSGGGYEGGGALATVEDTCFE